MDEALLPDVQGQSDPPAVVRVGVQPGQLSAAAGATQEYSAVVVDDASGEVRKDRCEGDAALEVCVLSTGGGRPPTTTVRSDPGADRTTCYATCSVSIRLRSPVGNKEEVFGESNGECMAFGQQTTPELTLRKGVGHQDGL